MEHHNGGLYVIIDNKAQMIVGQPTIHKHKATATRFFSDVCAQQDTIVAKHTEDFDLYLIGYLNLDNELIPDKQLVLSGSAWLAMQNPTTQEN